MKITYKKYNAVASWRWDIQPLPEPGPGPETTAAAASFQQAKRVADLEDWQDQDSLDGMDQDWQESEPDEDDEVCGICQLEFESACPGCKVPGDDCPLMWGQCTHVFHMHCLLKWLNTESSKEQCPLDRRPWVTAERDTASHGAHVPVSVRVAPAVESARPDDGLVVGEESDIELRLAIEASRQA